MINLKNFSISKNNRLFKLKKYIIKIKLILEANNIKRLRQCYLYYKDKRAKKNRIYIINFITCHYYYLINLILSFIKIYKYRE